MYSVKELGNFFFGKLKEVVFFFSLETAFLFKVGSRINDYRSHKAMSGTAEEVGLLWMECLLILIMSWY